MIWKLLTRSLGQLGTIQSLGRSLLLRIAQVGHEYEKIMPFNRVCLSRSMYSASALVYRTFQAQRVMTVEASFLIAGACVTNAAFVLAAVVLYDLFVKVIKNEQMAYISCLLFCYNPASIFMSAVYTGSLYACLSFYGMLYLERTSYYSSSTGFRYCAETLMSMLLLRVHAPHAQMVCYWACTLPTSFSKTSSGQLLSFCKVHHGHADHGISNQSSLKKALFVMKNAVTSLCSVAPYFLVQSYGYELYCVGRKGKLRPQWCKDSNIYKHVQERYWGRGVIFGYWTINQIPNFVLAAPILYVSYFAFFHYIQKTIHQKSYVTNTIVFELYHLESWIELYSRLY